MNHLRWAAWGVVDIEKLERMQRRNYIKRSRTELAEHSVMLECGGSTVNPYYRIVLPTAEGEDKPRTHAVGGVDAFRKVAQWVLTELGEANVGGADGSVRRAGDEAQASH